MRGPSSNPQVQMNCGQASQAEDDLFQDVRHVQGRRLIFVVEGRKNGPLAF